MIRASAALIGEDTRATRLHAGVQQVPALAAGVRIRVRRGLVAGIVLAAHECTPLPARAASARLRRAYSRA